MSIGTRGDMEPFLSIGEILQGKGHHVICAFPGQFEGVVGDANFKFESLGTKYIETLESKDGIDAMGGGSAGIKKYFAYVRLAKYQKEANKELVRRQYEIIKKENPDRIVYNGKSLYPVIWELKNRGKTVFVSPLPYMHYVKEHSHVVFNSNLGTFLNKLSFSLAHFGMVTTILIIKKWLKLTERISRKELRNILKYNKTIYTISPSLFSRPHYWNKNLKILGFYDRKKTDDWHPDKTLTDFISKHNKVLFITFGSMVNAEPEEKTHMIVDILRRNKIAAVINTADGGLKKPEGIESGLIHFVRQVPYSWIFPKIYGVIHHGGSGTTQMALKYGCPTMIIPHIIDQFVWNKIIYKLGLGPKGISIGRLNRKNLETKIIDLVNNEEYIMKAARIAHQMQREDFTEELYKTIIG